MNTSAAPSAAQIRLAKALYESDRKVHNARIIGDNHSLRRDSLLRRSDISLPWHRMVNTGGWIGEHPRDRYLRLAAVALSITQP